MNLDLATLGSACFGLVIGWITYRTLSRKAGPVALSDLATVLGVVGGGVVTGLFDQPDLFGSYAIGLAAGFFAYAIARLVLTKGKAADEWLGD
jgi:hypothetical protein